MGLADQVPGMEPGETPRNIVIGVLYIILWPFALFHLLGLAFKRNYFRLADRLATLPGITAGRI